MQTVDENTSGMCKAMREIQDEISRSRQERDRSRQESDRLQKEIERLQELLKANGIQYQ